MTMRDSNDTGDSQFPHSGGQSADHNRPELRLRNQPSSSVRPDSDVKKSRTHLSSNRGKLSTPYKSQLCLLYQRGKCFYENCHYAHSVTEIRTPGFHPVARNMKVCHWFSKGLDCPYGNKCQFLHKCDQKKGKDVNLYRQSSSVKRCSNWDRFGSCPYGVKCIYAHGREEPRDSRFHLDKEHSYASKSSKPISAECAFGATIARKLQLKGKSCFTKWDIATVSEIYADWIDGKQNMSAPLCKVRR